MKNKVNIQFYIVMIAGLCMAICLSIYQFCALQTHAALISLIAAGMFIMIIVHKYLADKELGKALKVLNWIILLFAFICIAAESGVLFK
ncbi:hypothetical protein [uncultured Lactobacillus sp.]|uniref:hypothetical protein n=1 Tax=uncultured Lactobacillus sp. TaxID=153152 RepID=UPI0026098944|nr:hypothetical protein [uncultured Lactobacillus sp.]